MMHRPLLLLCSAAFAAVVSSLNLSAFESLLWKSRLESIQESILSSPHYRELLAAATATATGGEHLAIIFPGRDGVDSLTEELAMRLNNGQNDDSTKVWATTVDWKEFCGNIATAAFDAEAVGQAMATLVLQQQQRQGSLFPTSASGCTSSKKDHNMHPPLPLKSIHVIGISVGAFAANRMAKCLFEAAAPTRLDHVRLTLLDPFCWRGLWGFGYGAKHFGLYADYAEHYLNTDDPVPSTNEALPHCYCLDVTGAPERESFVLPQGESMHCWPVAYYARHGYRGPPAIGKDGSTIQYPQHDDKHLRGMITKL